MLKSFIRRVSQKSQLWIRSKFLNRSRKLLKTAGVLAALAASASTASAQHQFPGDIDYTIPQDQYAIPDYSGSLNSQPDRGVGGFGVMGRAGHEAGDTVGRNGSISFVDIAPFSFNGNTMFFGDGRLFVTNRGKWGGSAGLGVRHFLPAKNTVLGTTFYYDHDQSRGVTFEQFTVAGEILTEFVDLRANVYVPFGNKQQVTAVRFEPGTEAFVDAFAPGGAVQGSNIEFQTRTFSSAALEGVDLTLTSPIPGPFFEKHNLEATAGGYHYQARGLGLQKISGFKLRLDGDFFDELTHLALEITSDNAFDTNVVFGADINYWHHLKKQPRLGKSQYDRMASWVRKNRTVATLDSSALDVPQLAINPLDNEPYLVYHVRNNPTPPPNNFPAPTGNGSENMPFQYIQEGIDASPLADIVYVHANSVFDGIVDGNANATGVLRENVLVLGEGVPLTIPTVGLVSEIDLPTVTPGPVTRPIIQNVTGPVITLADNSRFAGFQISDYADGPAVLADGVNGSIVNELIIQNSTGADADGIAVNNSTGPFVFENIAISGTSGNALEFTGGNATIVFNGANTVNNSAGHALFIEDTAGSINLRNTAIMGDGGQGVFINGTSATANTSNITLEMVSLLNTAPGVGRTAAFEVNQIAGGLSVLDTLTITSPTSGGITLSELQETSSVVFQETVDIIDRTEVGLLIQNIQEGPNPLMAGTSISGRVNFQNDLNITGLSGGASTAAAIDMESDLGTVLLNNVIILGSNGFGIDISERDTEGITTGTFQVAGLSRINGTADNAINITGNDSTNFQSIFSDININARGRHAIEVSTSGSISRFLGTTAIDNQQNITDSAIFVSANTGTIGFNVVDIDNALGDATILGLRNFSAVYVRDNINPDDNEIADVSFSSLDIEFTGLPPAAAPGSNQFEVAASIVDNENVSIGTGIIEAEEARAIFVFDTDESDGVQVHNIQFESISATNENTGIAVSNSDGTFIVTGRGDIAGSGGTISGMTNIGAGFDNTQVVRLGYMDIEANVIGVQAFDMIVESQQGLAPELVLEGMNIEDSLQEGIDIDDVSDFELLDSNLDGNGLATGSSQISYLATVEETDIDLDGDDEDPVVYNIAMTNNSITDTNTTTFGNMIDIATGPGIGDGAELNFLFQNNGIPGTIAAFNTISSNRTNAALSVDWEGPSDIIIDNNTFLMNAAVGEIGIEFDLDGVANVAFTNNDVASNGDLATGLDFNFEESTTLVIGSNSVINDDGTVRPGSGFQMNGIGSTAILLGFQSGGNDINIFDNLINMSGFDSTGIDFSRIFAPSTVAIDNNFIGLVTDFDTAREEGIIFRDVRGVINLNGTQDNSIPLGTFLPFYIDFFIPDGTSNGQIIINGSPRP